MTRPIASAAAFDAAQFAGRWFAVAEYPTAFAADCAGSAFEFAGQTVRFDCLDATGAAQWSRAGTALPAGPGRIAVDIGSDFPAPAFWVIWVAHDYDTAVIGAPDGRAGWIISRDRAISADRMTAAREMLDFNGYDLAGLVTLPRR